VGLRNLVASHQQFDLGRKQAKLKRDRRALALALALHEKRLAAAGDVVTEVQLLGQLSSASDWPKLLAYWERSVGTYWPRTLPADAYALNLWPVPPRPMKRATEMISDVRKRQPKKLLSTPALNLFTPKTVSSLQLKMNSDALAVIAREGLCELCASWLEGIGVKEFSALRVAPPILEIWSPGGRLISREVVDFGLNWPLVVV
jgi:hypothetical protein